jgi:hypothetical protein
MAISDAKGHLQTLRAMRDKLAADMDVADPSVVAQLNGQLMRLLDKISDLEAATPEVSTSDDIARELASGLADAKVVQLAGRGRKRSAG